MANEKREKMELSLDDPAFALMKIMLGNEIKKAAEQVDQESDVDEATITMKVIVRKEEAFIPNRNPAEKLAIDFKISRQIVKKESGDGSVYELNQYEIGYDEKGDIQLHRIYDPQHTVDEYL